MDYFGLIPCQDGTLTGRFVPGLPEQKPPRVQRFSPTAGAEPRRKKSEHTRSRGGAGRVDRIESNTEKQRVKRRHTKDVALS
jgi:hypothetical protein